MSVQRGGLVLIATLLLSACTSELPPQKGMVTTNTIVITNSGATNLIGWRVLIARDGTASWADGRGSGRSALSASIKGRLDRDIAAAKPLANLPPGECMKSASFGTFTYIVLGGDRSPDLSCPGNDAARTLKGDIDAVTTNLDIDIVPRSQGHDLPPENF